MDNNDAKARVTRVSIDRLYNLGNYEHIKYSIGIEIPEGIDVVDAVSKLRQILRALKPLKAEGYAEKKMRSLAAMSTEEQAAEIAKPHGRGADEEDFNEARKWVANRDARKAKRQAALKLFNDLGGESVYTDHKEQWDDNYEED